MKTILLGIDTSGRAPALLQECAELARLLGAKMHVARAVGIPPELPTQALSVAPAQVVQMLVEAARADLDKLLTAVDPGLLASIIVEVGNPADVLLTQAKDLHVDLIVIGAHGYKGIERLIGTTASKVVNKADRSVLVLRTTPPKD